MLLAQKAPMTKSQGSLLLAVTSAFLVGSCSSDGLDTPGRTCNYEGTTYALGQSFKDKDDCNTCTCTESGVACTLMLCVPPPFGGSGGGGSGGIGGSGSGGVAGNGGQGGSGGSIITPDAAVQGCVEDGHAYAVGETFKRDCNTCTCMADGASCTKMACPKPVDAGAEVSAAPDAARTCSYNGRTYLQGESFNVDCNTCICTTNGMACTGAICFHDASPDLGSLIDRPPCALADNLTFGFDGGNAPFFDVNRLTATSFTITRNYSRLAGRDGEASPSCSPALPACGASGVTVATINADLADADVQSVWALPQDPTPFFGSDPRSVDGPVYSISLDDGRKVVVGDQCASPAMSSCRYIPAGLVQLVRDLKQLASAMLADPVCKPLL